MCPFKQGSDAHVWKGESFPRRAAENQLGAGLEGIRLVDKGVEAVSPAGLWQLCALILATPLVGTLVGALRVCRPPQAGLTSEVFSHRDDNNKDNPVYVCSTSVSTNAFTDVFTFESKRS